MQCLRFILPPFMVLAVLFLTGALGQPPRQTAPQPATGKKSPPPPKPDKEATKLLATAIQSLSGHAWIETTFWQQASMHNLTFQAEGKYLAEPPKRHLRMDLAVHVGNATGKLEVISDGAVVWEKLQLGKDARPEIRKTEIKKILEALRGSNQEQVQAALLQTQSLAGVAPLLQNIQEQMTVTRQDKTSWQGHDVTRLTAVWSEATTRGRTPPTGSWLAFLPRKCHVDLGLKDGPVPYWPYRVEWWGPTDSSNEDQLLLQMEFRNPKVTSSLTADQSRQLFTFEPGVAQVTDQTRESTERARNRATQLATPAIK